MFRHAKKNSARIHSNMQVNDVSYISFAYSWRTDQTPETFHTTNNISELKWNCFRLNSNCKCVCVSVKKRNGNFIDLVEGKRPQKKISKYLYSSMHGLFSSSTQNACDYYDGIMHNRNDYSKRINGAIKTWFYVVQ